MQPHPHEDWLRKPFKKATIGVCGAYFHQATHFMELLQWYKVYKLGEDETPHGGLKGSLAPIDW